MLRHWFRLVNVKNPELRVWSNQIWRDWQKDIALALVVGFLVCIAFLAGRASVLSFDIQKPPLEEYALSNVPLQSETGMRESGILVASKKGKKYHLPECPGAQKIAEENKIYFTTHEEAEEAGYQPAANCPGLLGNKKL